MISKPGEQPDDKADTTPSDEHAETSQDQLTIDEEPVAPIGFLQSVNLGESDEDEELDLAEAQSPHAPTTPPDASASSASTRPPTKPQNTPEKEPQKPRRPVIMSFEDAVKADMNRPRPAPTSPPQERPASQPKPRATPRPVAAEPEPDTAPNAAPTCPQCQADVPAGIERCPFCGSLMAPIQDEAIAKAAEAAVDTQVMRVLRKRGMEHVVKNVAREAAERDALERKLANEQTFYDHLVPAGAAAAGLTLMLFIGLLGLRHTGVQNVIFVQLFWVVLVITPSVLGTVLIGQLTSDADFHLERTPVVKLAGLILGPWGVAAAFAPGLYPQPDTMTAVILVLISGLVLNAMIGVVYRVRLHLSSILMLAYILLTFLCLTTIALPLVRALGMLP